MAESEQQAEGQNNGVLAGVPVNPNAESSMIMKDWLLVAAGLERLFFSIYALSFAIITSVYV